MSASQLPARCVPCAALEGERPSHCLQSYSTAGVIGARRTLQAAQQRGILTASGTVGARTASNVSAAKGWSSEPCGSVISRQFTSLRELAPAARLDYVRQAYCQRARPCSWRPAVSPPQQHQLRCFAAAGSSSSGGGSSGIRAAAGGASSAAAGSRRTAQRASVDQKSSSQALYLASTSTDATNGHPICSRLGMQRHGGCGLFVEGLRRVAGGNDCRHGRRDICFGPFVPDVLPGKRRRIPVGYGFDGYSPSAGWITTHMWSQATGYGGTVAEGRVRQLRMGATFSSALLLLSALRCMAACHGQAVNH